MLINYTFINHVENKLTPSFLDRNWPLVREFFYTNFNFWFCFFAQNWPKYGTWGYNGQLEKSQFIVWVCLHDLYIISENHRCQWSVRLSRSSIVNRALDPGRWVPAPDYPGPASAILIEEKLSSPLYLWVVGWSARCRGGSVARFISENVLFVFFQYIR